MRAMVLSALALAAATAGCAAFGPPEPCTSAWYDYETREAFRPVRRELGRTINQLQSAQTALASPDPGLGAAVRLAFALENGLSLLEAVERESLPRLQLAATTCDDPAFVRRAVFDFLDQEGVDDLFDAAGGAGGFASLLDLSGRLDTMLAPYAMAP